jgi:acetolactate synthase-1/2/3 large subunit
VLREELPDEAIVVTDVTQMGYFIQYGMPFYQPRTCITSGYQATLGFAMPTALGAQVAFPDRKVVAICGDGGFMFNVQEMSTAVAHNISVVTIVFDDGAFGNVKKIQKESYGARHIGVDLTNPDFVTLAKSFGMLGIKAETPDALRAALREAFAARGPALIHVPVGELPDIWKLVQRPPSQGPAPSR